MRGLIVFRFLLCSQNIIAATSRSKKPIGKWLSGSGQLRMATSSLSARPIAAEDPAGSTAWGSAILLATAGGMALATSINDVHPMVTLNHCQVPCGIFDDPAIVDELKQACTTIRKAIRSSKTLHATVKSDVLSLNQLIRWVTTKEEHCSKIISLVSEYCLCQRVKRPNFKTETEYLEALKVHHRVMQAAMKAKQSMDEQDCIVLEHAVEDLSKTQRFRLQ